MENTENKKVTEESTPLNNSEKTQDSNIVISENGGLAPNVSAAVQKLIQSSETSDKTAAKVNCDAIQAYKEIAKAHPELARPALDAIVRTVESANKAGMNKTFVRTLTVIACFGVGVGVGGIMLMMYFSNNEDKSQNLTVNLDNNDDLKDTVNDESVEDELT